MPFLQKTGLRLVYFSLGEAVYKVPLHRGFPLCTLVSSPRYQKETECSNALLRHGPHLRIGIWILPSDTLFGDGFYCSCFDHPNKETVMLSTVTAWPTWCYIYYRINISLTTVDNVDKNLRIYGVAFGQLSQRFIGQSKASKLSLWRSRLHLIYKKYNESTTSSSASSPSCSWWWSSRS